MTEIIRQQTKDIPGAEISVSASSAMSMGMGGGSVSLTVKGDDLDTLRDIGKDMIDLISTVPGTREATSSYEDGIPEVRIASDRAVAAQYGLTTAQIGSTVKNVLSGSTVSKYKIDGDELDIVLKGDNLYKESMSMLETMPVSTATGGTVPLGEVAQISVQKGPVSIMRENQTRVMTVSADIAGRDIQSVSQDVSEVLATYDMPQGYTYEFGGTTEQMNETFSDLFLAIIMAIVLVYMILAAQFESMIQPLSIMFAVPLALSGGFIALFITRTPLNVVSLIGFIMLVGIVVNNAIVLIDYINTRRSMGEERTAAILKAGPIRIRPIMMTALTTILGLIPMSLGIGEGAELTSSMGIVVIGGLALSTLLTLLFVPVMYSIFDDIIEFVKRKLGLKKYGVIEQN